MSTPSARTPGRGRPEDRRGADTTLEKSGTTSGDSACEGSSRTSETSRQVNRTFVVSAPSKSGGGQQTPHRSRLTLQRRSRRRTGAEAAEGSAAESSQNTTPAPEKRLTLQRRTRTPSMDKGAPGQRGVGGGTGLQPKVLREPNGRTPSLLRCASLREAAAKSKGREPAAADTRARPAGTTPSAARQPDEQAHTCETPTKKTPFEKIAAKRAVFEGLARREAPPRPAAGKSASLERPKVSRVTQDGKPAAAPRVSRAPADAHRPTASRASGSGQRGDSTSRDSTSPPHPAPGEQPPTRPGEAAKQPDAFKMENSAVTVAVRVRPFSARERAEKALQVIFMNNQETVVQHPESKQSYSFTYDFSFCSVDESERAFASQQTVYETLAKPLLLRAFEGFNTCLFAYGQTGSGKSYTMMGFGEEAGVIPRFCRELFSRLTSIENKEVKCHVEMSYFEVYNEKIHDLLVTRDEPNQRTMPLRVREHPVHGPYVAELSANVVSSYNDIKEGASINKSLLTLGKVISALSEQALTRRKVFTPYRESVLTWLLKESLGGNSKTAMIATLSPAGSNVEESLSTLRYAQQARTIINVAKVNEDTSAKLIRELKAEVEKLRAAQMSSLGIEPESVRLFQQEISCLKTKLCQQEREMIEANRAWREKLEQAEIRKREETKELQKAGVTLKVDNRLPNLVNLNEDPQLSEMLLYMIKEGQTTVGKHKSDSSHDIQLTGALIADQHCVITSLHGTVSITPMESAKTFVNGNLISDSIVLHHGDRVILGGDHYFRFNHPAEVQSGKRVSCWTGAGDGHKDFEFAKNELLVAQRVQLEAEIEEAHLKAKEEMMQGIQMAKEVAQKELSDQKALYEDRIHALETELNEETARKRQQELDQQRVANQVAKLKVAKMELEQEVDTHKKRLRLHMETQAMEEQRVSQVRIVEALEAEKRKIAKELEEMQKKRTLRENHTPQNVSPHWGAMKLSLMIEEANKISAKLKKNTVFSRHESSGNDNLEQGGLLQVRVQNTKLGISTFWSLDKFQNNMAAMRELEQGDSTSKDDDVFYGPDDEWEQDISASSASTSSFSRRRSRSLLKSRRISGRLYEIRVHPIQSLHSGPSQCSGLMGVAKPPSTHSSSAESALPGICKELIGQSVAHLRGCSGTEESLADRLASDLNLVYEAVQTISDLYDSLEDDSQENVFVCNSVAQTQLVKATAAIESAVFVTTQWLVGVKPVSGLLYTITEELKSQVKKMGGFFQLLIQGCESEITSMVKEAQRKSSQCLDAALLALGHLAAVTCMPLNAVELGAQATGKPSMTVCLLKGTNRGVRSLLEESLTVTREMLREAQLSYPRNPSLKSKTLDLACALQSYMHCHISERESDPQEVEEAMEEASASHLKKLRTTATKLFQLNQAIRQLHSSLSAALRGKDRDSNFSSCRELISSYAEAVDELISGLSKEGALAPSLQLPCLQSVVTARDKLHSALQSLSSPWDEQGAGASRSSVASDKSTGDEILTKESTSTQSAVRNRVQVTSPPVTRQPLVAPEHRMHWLLMPKLGFLVYFHSCISAFTLETRSLTYHEFYYEYVPDRLQWTSAGELCNQRSGALATVTNSEENRNLTTFLKSLNISEPVWIARKVMTYLTSSSDTLILEFSGRSDRKHARLLHKFSSMGSVTVCTRLRFDPNCFGISTIFSYSIQSHINEFQLRANLIQGKPVQLALMVHGIHGPYQEAVDHDDSWHSVCVSWSQNGGRWALYTHGLGFSRGDGLNSSDSIGPDGLFIIGQEQDTFGGSFKKDESFSGSITELHIWDRVLNGSEIFTMEKECSLISSGLVFKWSGAAMEIESSLTKLWRDNPCQGNFTVLANPFLDSLKDGDALQNQTFELFQSPQSDVDCGIFDPVVEHWSLAKCDSFRGAVCQFKKEVLDVFSLPKSPFFSRLSRDPLTKPVMDELSINSSWDRDLTSLQQLSQAVLLTVEAGGQNVLTPSDVLYLSRMIETDLSAAASIHSAGRDAAEVMVSIATNYLKAASLMLEPSIATQWIGRSEDGFSVGPFTIVKSIDSLTDDLADMLSAERRGFTLSTKNIDVYMKWQKLSEEHCRQVFKPSVVSSGTTISSGGQDELIIPDTELQRIHALGYEEVMFIHTHYSHLSEIESGTQEPPVSPQEKFQSIPKSDRTSIHKNLFIALICAQVILLCSSSAIHNKVACTLVAALLHLFFMAAFSWMLVEGLLLWSKVVAVNLSEERHMKYYYLIGWGLPVLIVTITLASASGKYAADGYCWLSVQNGIIWGFAGPVIFIIMVNIMILTRVVVITVSTAKRRSIMLAMGTSPVEQTYEQISALTSSVSHFRNDYQGLFIFLIYGVYNTEVRSTVNRIKERRKALNFSVCNPRFSCEQCSTFIPAMSSSTVGYKFLIQDKPSPDIKVSGQYLYLVGRCCLAEMVRSTVNRIKERRKALNFSVCNPRFSCEQFVNDPEIILISVGWCVTAGLPKGFGDREGSREMCERHKANYRTEEGRGSLQSYILLNEAHPPSEVDDDLPAGCSLHVPMELEFTTSCFPRSPAPQKSHGLVCVD
ncbi:hypothetical protein F2P81_005539 [Scophthalmus maximus]|uniref:Kinesin-like protein KIF14 n=1 Tax=Scophthalmus maximus TaxID=52904 RepID=A0A6A4T6V5_SCOMX|nr:hypothetical protein F2P81_005539 [Scophthalmus maximus]